MTRSPSGMPRNLLTAHLLRFTMTLILTHAVSYFLPHSTRSGELHEHIFKSMAIPEESHRTSRLLPVQFPRSAFSSVTRKAKGRILKLTSRCWHMYIWRSRAQEALLSNLVSEVFRLARPLSHTPSLKYLCAELRCEFIPWHQRLVRPSAVAPRPMRHTSCPRTFALTQSPGNNVLPIPKYDG